MKGKTTSFPLFPQLGEREWGTKGLSPPLTFPPFPQTNSHLPNKGEREGERPSSSLRPTTAVTLVKGGVREEKRGGLYLPFLKPIEQIRLLPRTKEEEAVRSFETSISYSACLPAFLLLFLSLRGQ